MVLTSLRQFRRNKDGISIPLQLDEWPADVPLPKGSTIVGIGRNHEQLVHPQWRFVLEPERTVEVVTGWFQTSLSLEETLAWFRGELGKLGWEERPEEGYITPPRAGLKFEYPESEVRVSLSLQWWPALRHTTVMIWRVVEHPWEPVEVEELEALEQLQGEGEEEKWEEEEVVVGS